MRRTRPLDNILFDEVNDLACFKLQDCVPTIDLPALDLADARGTPPRYGQTLHVLGYPSGYPRGTAIYSSCCFGGEIHREGRHRIVLTGGGIFHGNSGGPLIAMSPDRKSSIVFGVIVGIMKEDQRAFGVSEAVPCTVVHRFLQEKLAVSPATPLMAVIESL